ncbi:MAG TPA: type II secretion system protein N, partial [Acidiferrobacterales bacterium]|nr:type II secretion system protein N [Acidiferrobacterales bacterium]
MTSMAQMMPAAEQLIEKLGSSRWTPIGVNVVAILLLTYSMAQWSWRLMEPAPALHDQRPSAPIADSASELRQLLSANLFGQADVAAGQGLSPSSIPLTSLNLVLTGVMVGGSNNFAFISINGANETAFGLGDEILAGATLHAVYPDRAVLRRGGALESLVLKDSIALPEGSVVTSPQYRKDAPLSGIRGSGTSFTVERSTLTQQMQKPEFLSQALMVPNAGGGFLVREIQPGSVYEKLGVRTGDVIRSVN